MLKQNSYFEGKVQSIGFRQDDADKTVGVIDAGTYHFGTSAPEKMTIVSGSAKVTLDGQTETQTVTAGDVFHVPGNSGFTISVSSGATAYLCEFLAP